MKLKLILTTVVVGLALALPNAASAAPPPPPPTQDSVSLTEGPGTIDGGPVVLGLNATSGPSGENPTGEVMLAITPNLIDLGPVTCLAVSGNIATLNFESQFLGQIVTLQVVDDNPDTISFHVLGRAASDCSAPPPVNINPLSSGDITVVDAQPPPTTKAQCMNGGWQQLGFANQGQCIAFVNHAP